MNIPRTAGVAAALAVAAVLPAVASAQQQAQQQAQRQVVLEEITVTARQREENLFDVPLSVTTLTAADIDRAQLNDIADLMRFTPGFDYKTQNTQNGARILPNFRFRGMNAGFAGSLTQLGAIFVDGLYLHGGAQSLTFEDVARVEVIKGPQSAYFGRSTFGGAVNFITREPSEEYARRAAGSAETRGGYTVSGSAEGPIGDRVRFRLSGARNWVGAHYEAADGGDLGRQRTDSVNAQVVLLPTEDLKLRVRYNRSWDNDSVPATVVLNASRPDIQGNPAECTTGTLPFWCGELPKLGDVGVPASIISVPTTPITPAFARSNSPNIVRDILGFNTANPLTARDFALHDRLPDLDELGMRRHTRWISVAADYDFADGYLLHASGSDSRSALLAAASLLPDGASVSISPGIFENWEIEGRLVSPQDRRFTWLVGGNMFEQKELGLPASGFAVRVNTLNQIVYTPPQLYGSQGKVSYWGAFAGVHYDITPQLAVDLEARYQSDEVTNAYRSPSETRRTYKDVAPRAILTYRPQDGLTVYGSWARGINPGFVNATINLVSPALRAQVLADPGFAESVSSETLDSFEIGVKQQFDTIRYALAAYYMDWNNLKNQVNYICPGAVCGPNFFAFSVGFTTARSGTLKGLEGEVTALITDRWDVNLNFEIVDSKFDSFSSALAFAATGKTFGTDIKILEYPQQSASLSSSYRIPVGGDYDWYLRGALTYTGKTYADEFSQSWIGDWFNASLRTGLEREGRRVEAYVNNLFDQRQWISARRGSAVLDPRPAGAINYPTIFATPARKQVFGMRAAYEF